MDANAFHKGCDSCQRIERYMSLTGCAFNRLKYSYRSMKGSPPAFILLPLKVHNDLRRKIFFGCWHSWVFWFLGGMRGKGVSPFLSFCRFVVVSALRIAMVVTGILSERPFCVFSKDFFNSPMLL